MNHALGTFLALLAAIAILTSPLLFAWVTGKLAARRDRRSHPWSCDCRERRQDARSRHPSGQAMDSASRLLWAELDAFSGLEDDPHWRRVTDILGAPYAADYDPDRTDERGQP